MQSPILISIASIIPGLGLWLIGKRRHAIIAAALVFGSVLIFLLSPWETLTSWSCNIVIFLWAMQGLYAGYIARLAQTIKSGTLQPTKESMPITPPPSELSRFEKASFEAKEYVHQSEDRVHFPVWRTLLNLVIAVVSAALAPFPVWILIIPLWLVLGALSYYAPPGILQDLAEAALIIASAVLYLGGAAALGVGVGFVIFGIPTAILGWHLGRITPRSSIIAGFLIGCLPYLLILPFDQSFGPNYPSTSAEILRVAGETLAMGAFGAFEGFLFWLVWRVLSRRSMSTQRPAQHEDNAPDLG